jgi:ABC-type proline/glycine betaine transport system permease subunit
MTLTFDYQELSGIIMLHLVLGTVAILCSLLLIVPLGYLCFRQLVFSGKGITTL